ncbi:putative membrane protein YphA (DoxX/SURF4 family)/CheY-like chemotaxis protein [Algoriphagus iocasae]|uniref:Putative membrane protein YphA (DoxX/SURF4 family)/CheY-like chemotaxis protein n=1 Tax=Algoriphagus iocasae TaxID=1836499 RepID=A0A841MIB3_9BACT|nr:BT_3928 family protein [Algoriphagus iocasae]MBB6325059.1 putative membrane protein YphA (DoxX/SURF4 family)/CheY-like chemotaxis protein [Algoriphagus iocasae]
MIKDGFLWVLRLLVGGLFIFSGLIKVNDPVGTSIKLEEYFDVFSNDIAGFFAAFEPFALQIGVFLVVVEVVLGVMLILGVKSRFTVWALGLMILFFTFLTFYSAYFNKVTDCGCFGDAIKLTPWESFYKDIILLVLITILFLFRDDLPDSSPMWANGLVVLVLISSLVLSILAIRNLPFIDFRAYKVGVNIPQAMEPSAPLLYSYVMKKDGETVILDSYPSDESYEFVEMNIKNPENLPKISDFAVWNENGDYSAEMFNGNKVAILVSSMPKMDDSNLEQIDALIASLRNSPIEVVFVAAATEEEITKLISERGWGITGLQADATVVKTIIRSNPGIMILKDGEVLSKYHHNNTPEAGEVLDLFMK